MQVGVGGLCTWQLAIHIKGFSRQPELSAYMHLL